MTLLAAWNLVMDLQRLDRVKEALGIADDTLKGVAGPGGQPRGGQPGASVAGAGMRPPPDAAGGRTPSRSGRS